MKAQRDPSDGGLDVSPLGFESWISGYRGTVWV